MNSIVTGDARELAKAIPNESVDLIFTDPIYSNIDDYRWLAETAARVLKPDRWALIHYGIGYLPQTAAALSEFLSYEWCHVYYMPSLNARGAYRTFSNYRGLMRYKKGQARPYRDARDLLVDGFNAKNNGHAWTKSINVSMNWMDAYSEPAAVVFDSFCGGGTVPVVCKMLGRNYLAFEIDPQTAERARERIRHTPMPLFVMPPEQLAFIEEV